MDDSSPVEINARSNVDHAMLAKGLILVLQAFSKPDWNEISASSNIHRDDLLNSVPAALASGLAEQFLQSIVSADTISEFVNGGLDMICEIAASITLLTPEAKDGTIQSIISNLRDYAVAKSGSPGEVLAERNIGELTEQMNNDILRRNPSLYAAFVDEDSGFSVTAAQSLLSALTDDDESEESDDSDDDSDSSYILQG